MICSAAAWIIILGSCFFLCVHPAIYYIAYMVLFRAVPHLLLHPVVLSCGCSQSSEAVRTRRESERERGGKPHEEKSFSFHSNMYCEHSYHICPIYSHRILYHFNRTEYPCTLVHLFVLLCVGWFCSACSLSAPLWKTLLPLFLSSLCSFGSVVEHCVSSAKGCGFDSQGTHIVIKHV